MDRLHCSAFLVIGFLSIGAIFGEAQTTTPSTPQAAASTIPPPGNSEPIPANAPRMSKETRLEIIRDFETQLVYARTPFPMGSKGLQLRNGTTAPNGQALQQLIAIYGPSIKPGDPTHISYVHIKDNYIHFELNGGPVRRQKWYQHIQVSGASGNSVPISNNESVQNPHGSFLDVYFDKYVPEMNPAQLRDLLYPALDFKAKSKEEAYLDTVPPKVKEAIQAHHVLIGMNTEMVVHAVGKAPRKVREKDNGVDYEEWIYGQPPQDVDFVRIVGDEVVRVETMKVGGQKIVRTEKEVILAKPKEEEAKTEQEGRPANAPSLRRPGEDAEDVPRPTDANGPAPLPPPPPPPVDGPGSPGPGEFIGRL
jgi:hypothetical protein